MYLSKGNYMPFSQASHRYILQYNMECMYGLLMAVWMVTWKWMFNMYKHNVRKQHQINLELSLMLFQATQCSTISNTLIYYTCKHNFNDDN